MSLEKEAKSNRTAMYISAVVAGVLLLAAGFLAISVSGDTAGGIVISAIAMFFGAVVGTILEKRASLARIRSIVFGIGIGGVFISGPIFLVYHFANQ